MLLPAPLLVHGVLRLPLAGRPPACRTICPPACNCHLPSFIPLHRLSTPLRAQHADERAPGRPAAPGRRAVVRAALAAGAAHAGRGPGLHTAALQLAALPALDCAQLVRRRPLAWHRLLPFLAQSLNLSSLLNSSPKHRYPVYMSKFCPSLPCPCPAAEPEPVQHRHLWLPAKGDEPAGHRAVHLPGRQPAGGCACRSAPADSSRRFVPALACSPALAPWRRARHCKRC